MLNNHIKKTLIICLAALWLAFPINVQAEEIVSQENSLDVTFVIDYSGSMKTNDPQGIGKGMVKAFIDTVHSQDIRVGYVAYSDKIISSVSPVPMADPAERERLKSLIDSSPYSGDTDIGLGVSFAYDLMPYEDGRNRIMILISDGEPDLKAGGIRTLEQSKDDLNRCVEQCASEGIPIYTIAFGAYEGSKGTLEKIAADTGASGYAAESPEALIEVLYGIFNNNMSYKIQQFSSGVYAGGRQEIRCVLDEDYLDEMDVLLISSGAVGDTVLQYGDKQIPMSKQSYYSVGKIDTEDINDSIHELIVNTSTVEGQSLKIFLISYRKLIPTLDLESKVSKNKSTGYRVFFKNKNGDVIQGEGFYKKFQWELVCTEPQESKAVRIGETNAGSEGLAGEVEVNHSGDYRFQGTLSDNLGSYSFDASFSVSNTPPSGNLPETKVDILKQPISYDLNQFFKDEDGDMLTFSSDMNLEQEGVLQLQGNKLLIQPKNSGSRTITLFVSDGEDTLAYPFRVGIVPLWQAYWWVILLVCLLVSAILWKLFYKPKPEIQQIAEKKIGNRFAGKLDAYVTIQPEDTEEIPPLTFPMYKIKDSKVRLEDLVKEYPELSEHLDLSHVFLIADEDRKMILYHSTRSTVMIGGAIICQQLQYSVMFGDVIYITAPDGKYEIEIHYVALL